MKNMTTHYDPNGTWTVKASDGTILCQGDEKKVEDFLDHHDYHEYLRQKRIRQRIRRRMCKLLNWLYNRRKGR